MVKVLLTISTNPDVLEKFKEYCKLNGMTISGRVSKLMENDLKEKREEYNDIRETKEI